jgi:hypothetical protein
MVSVRGVRKSTRTKSVQSRKAKAKTYNKSRTSRNTPPPRTKPVIPKRGDGSRVRDDSDRAVFFHLNP